MHSVVISLMNYLLSSTTIVFQVSHQIEEYDEY